MLLINKTVHCMGLKEPHQDQNVGNQSIIVTGNIVVKSFLKNAYYEPMTINWQSWKLLL